MNRIGFIALFICLNVFATTSWQQEVKSLLPKPISEFKPRQTTLKEVEKNLGKAQHIQDSKYYWEKDGLKYALELTFESNVLTSLHYTFTGKKPDLMILHKHINVKNFTPYPKEGKSFGRFLKLQEQGSELIIDPVSKTIYSVRLP